MANLVDMVLGAFSPNAISEIGARVGETEGRTRAGLAALVPVLLAGAISKSRAGGGADLLALVSAAVKNGNPLDTLGSLLASDATRSSLMAEGTSTAQSLFGSQTGDIVSAVSAQADMKAAAVPGLLAMAAPVALGGLAKAAGPSLTSESLSSLLGRESEAINARVPDGLRSLFSLPPVVVPRETRPPAGAGIGDTPPVILKPKNHPLAWIVLGFGVLALLYSLVGQKRDRSVPVAEVAAAPVVAEETLSLPDGSILVVRTGSIGANLARYLATDEPAPRTFVFDNLNFDTAEDKVTPESVSTLSAIIAILKAYPAAKAEISGYTDNVGDPAANVALSTGRSATIARALVDSGIGADRVTTAGYGEANPVADNATEEGRAQNRRTELTVTEK